MILRPFGTHVVCGHSNILEDECSEEEGSVAAVGGEGWGQLGLQGSVGCSCEGALQVDLWHGDGGGTQGSAEEHHVGKLIRGDVLGESLTSQRWW